jgi:hypothetical protein
MEGEKRTTRGSRRTHSSARPSASEEGRPLNRDPGASASFDAPPKPANLEDREGPDKRRKRIQVAAYHLAEKRGFGAGGELEDWLEAEKRDDALNPRDC